MARAGPYPSGYPPGVRSVPRFLARCLRAVKLLARDGRIPKSLRWLAAFGLLPIPGPVDEAVLLLLAPIRFVFHRESMWEAWRQAGGAGGSSDGPRPP
jgi:hypothetical protein